MYGQSPEREIPHPSELGGEKGIRDGEASKHLDKLRQTRVYLATRYEAQSHGKATLIREAMRMLAAGESTKRYLGDVFRTIDCLARRHTYFVKVKHHVEFGTASYSGLVTCGSVWACPLCASKIQGRRRLEIEQVMSWHEEVNSGKAVMVTFTFPHIVFDSLRDLLYKQAKALQFLRKGRVWDELKKEMGYKGLVRGLEVTHGLNGWHPHTHELWLVTSDVQTAKLKEKLVDLWRSACLRAEILTRGDDHWAFNLHSVDVRDNVTSGDYLAKQDDIRAWGLADEIARGATKAGRAKGVHPHRFLTRREPGDDRLYLEYVKHMKGKRQIFWTPGLKRRASIVDYTDEELAEIDQPGAAILAAIPAPAWRIITGNDSRFEVIEAAENGGLPAIEELLRKLGCPEAHMPLNSDEYRNRWESLYEP